MRLLSLRISYWTKDFRAFSSGVGGAGGSIFTAERAALPDWRVCAGSGDRKPALTATSIEQDSILFSIFLQGGTACADVKGNWKAKCVHDQLEHARRS